MRRRTDNKRCARSARSLTIAVISCAVALAGCGSSSTHGAGHGAGAGAGADVSFVPFSQCMRANGVPNFPDLSNKGMQIASSGQTLSVDGVSVNTPAFVAARGKCQKYMPGSTVASSSQQARALAGALTFARCMRRHGVPNFPDPKVRPGPSGNGVVDLRGAGLNFNSPAFLAATSACGGGPKGP